MSLYVFAYKKLRRRLRYKRCFSLRAGRRGSVHAIQVQSFRAGDCSLSLVTARAVQPLPAQSTAHPVSRACLPAAATAFLVTVAPLHC